MSDGVVRVAELPPKVEVGQTWRDAWGIVRVMAVVDGYVMYRRPHYIPSVASVKTFSLLHRYEADK